MPPWKVAQKELFADIFSLIKRMWNIELYVAEETVIAEGTKIVKPVGVTLGKVLQALLILVAGWWLARHLVRPVQWIVTTRFKKDESFANQVSKLFLLIMFVVVLFVSLVSVNIPLAVFAFFGGALIQRHRRCGRLGHLRSCGKWPLLSFFCHRLFLASF